MFIKRVLVANFKSEELRILNELIKIKALGGSLELGNIRQTTKVNITNALLSKIELLPNNVKFHSQVTMGDKHYSHVMGYKINKNNFIAISIGHQAMAPDKTMIMTGDYQSTMMYVVAEDIQALTILGNALCLDKFIQRLIALQNSWHMDFTRQFKVIMEDVQ